MIVNYDEVIRLLDFKRKVNTVDLEEIEWIRDDGSKIPISKELIDKWKLVGMTNFCFAELVVNFVVAKKELKSKDLLR